MSQNEEFEGAAHDLAPGDQAGEGDVLKEVLSYVIGLGLAAFLTAGSFWVANSPAGLYGPGILMALAALAIAQMGVHLAFFLHITTGPDNTNNALALAFGVLIVGLVIGGSIWIMYNLDTNMMSPDSMNTMQM